jgi:8-oxo-dGTP diphosphatase
MKSMKFRDLPTIAAAVIVHGEKLLLVKRRFAEKSLSWQFPAGEVEREEGVETAAVRETMEEVGLKVSALEVLGERVHPNTGRHIAYVACEVLSGEAYVADANELTDVAWMTLGECRDYVPYGFAPIVEEYLEATLVLR